MCTLSAKNVYLVSFQITADENHLMQIEISNKTGAFLWSESNLRGISGSPKSIILIGECT